MLKRVIKTQLERLPFFKFGTPGVCTYCGDVANSMDHCMTPVASYGVDRKAKGGLLTQCGPTTFACLQCNSLLGNRRFETFLDRCRLVSQYLSIRSKPVLWHPWEIAELDFPIQAMVKQDVAKRKLMRFRADWFQSREFCLNIEQILWNWESSPSVSKYFESTADLIKTVTSWSGSNE